MKKALFLAGIISILSQTTGLAINYYDKGDTLFVWAKSGLKLRKAPNLGAEVIKTIEFGDPITTTHFKGFDNNTPGVEIIEDHYVLPEGKKGTFKLRGYWVKVKHGKETGHVFDAYLSEWSPTQINLKEDGSQNLINYIRKSRSVLKESGHLEAGEEHKIIFQDGSLLRDKFIEGGYQMQLSIPGVSFEEIYLIFRYFDPYAVSISQNGYNLFEIHQDIGGYKVNIIDNSVYIFGVWSG